MRKFSVVLDTESIGSTFLVCCHTIQSGRDRHFWVEDRPQFEAFYLHPSVTFIVFNADYDIPLLQAFYEGCSGEKIKEISNTIIEEHLSLWQTLKRFDLRQPACDWVDIMPAAPGVKISLKTYAGRMHFPTMQDMPVDHTQDITNDPVARELVLNYCRNDVAVTAALYQTIKHEIDLRVQMTDQYKVDLRSKSGAQIAQTVLCKKANIGRKADIVIPPSVQYEAPAFIQTDNPAIQNLISKIRGHSFFINPNNGAPVFPDFLKDPIKLNSGVYQFGIGGLHSQHESGRYFKQTPDTHYVDADISSYYPNLILAAGIVPKLEDGKGADFIHAYRELLTRRLQAKRDGDKATANSLKLVANSSFGKLGERFCPFYSPDLLLAVTISGQLFLLSMIDKVERIPGVHVVSANTDGITIAYPPQARPQIEATLSDCPFEWEFADYARIAYNDVNTYIAVATDGKVKRKGRFAPAGVVESTNPTFQICADACAAYLATDTPIEETIRNCTDIRQFVSVRNVTGGGVLHLAYMSVDDWVLAVDNGNMTNQWHSAKLKKTVKRKSRPPPAAKAVGGVPFGRVARWYISTNGHMPITYVKNGNAVPESERAALCLNLPKEFPANVDFEWYITRAKRMLAAAGVTWERLCTSTPT